MIFTEAWLRLLTRGAVLLILIALVVGLVRWIRPTPAPMSSAPIILPDILLLKARPKLEPGFFGRLVKEEVKPAVVAVSAGKPDKARVSSFCAAAAADAKAAPPIVVQTSANGGDPANSDTASHIPVVIPVPLLPSFTGTYDGRWLTLSATRSDGSIMQASAKLRPHFDFLAGQGGSSDRLPVFHQDRWFLWLGRQTLHCLPRSLPMAGAGALLAPDKRVEGALVTGGSALLGCLLS